MNKGLLGVFFNYGTLIFSGTGNSKIKWKGISNPKNIRKQIEEFLRHIKKDNNLIYSKNFDE